MSVILHYDFRHNQRFEILSWLKNNSKRMTKTIYFSTVGLNFYKDQDIDIDDYISLLIGKTVILQHDTENADRYAIAVTLDGKIIGYVRRNDIDENNIHGYLMGCYHHCHIARFVAPSTLYKTIITEAKFIDVIPITAEKEIIESNWGIDTIKPEPIAEWRELTRVMNSMLTLLIYKVANVSNMRPLIDQYKKLAVLGFSKDFYDDRQELFRLLGECGDKDVAKMKVEVASLSETICDNATRIKSYHFIYREIEKNIKHILENCNVNLSRKDVEKMINIMPKDFSANIKYGKTFPRYLYYKRLPRKVLLDFLYTIVLNGMLNEDNTDHDTIRNYIVGPYKDDWMEFISKSIEGNGITMIGCTMRAYVNCGVLSSAPYRQMVNTFGNIGNEDSYHNGYNKYEDKKTKAYYDYMCELIESHKKIYL